MSKADPNITVFSGTERVSIKEITITPELAQWADANPDFIARVNKALADTHSDISDDQLWDLVAKASMDAEWCASRERLDKVQREWEENKPIGAIDAAVGSEEHNALSDNLNFSLAEFTIIDKGLREREDLKQLLNVLMVQKRMLEKSLATAEMARKSDMARAFAVAAPPQPPQEILQKAISRLKKALNSQNEELHKAAVQAFRRAASKKPPAKAQAKPPAPPAPTI